MKVLVSGGSSGIGAAACLRIAEAALARGVQPMIAVCGHKRTTSQEEPSIFTEPSKASS